MAEIKVPLWCIFKEWLKRIARGICLIFGVIAGMIVAALVFEYLLSITPEIVRLWGGKIFLVVAFGSILIMVLLVKWKEAKDHCTVQSMMRAEHDRAKEARDSDRSS